ELFVVVAASPSTIAELELPKAPAEPDGEFVPAINIPALTVVAPVYVFVPDKVSAPVPSLVNVPVPVPITELIVVFPAPPIIRPKAPVILPVDCVSVPPSELILDAEANVIVPVHVLLLARLRKAPAAPIPVPFSVMG